VLFLVFSREKRVPHVELVKDAAETPHIDRSVVGDAEHDLGGAVKARLDVGVNFLVLEAAGSKVDDLDARLVDLAEQNVFGLQVAMHNVVLAHVVKRNQDLNREPLNQRQRKALEVVHLDEIVEVYGEQFESDDEMLSEYELVQFLNNVLFVVGVFFVQHLN
jgi:hypothetical protein